MIFQTLFIILVTSELINTSLSLRLNKNEIVNLTSSEHSGSEIQIAENTRINELDLFSNDQGRSLKPGVRPPGINFYRSVAAGVGVFTNGFLVLRELSAALGTPLPIFIGAIPMFIFGVLLMFAPYYRGAMLPFPFYPLPAGGSFNTQLINLPSLPEFLMDPFTDLGPLKSAFEKFMKFQ